MANALFSQWLQVSVQEERLTVLAERPGARTVGLTSVRKLVADHFVGETTILQAGGYAKAAAAIANSLPTDKRTRSGDLGELLATEYIDAQTDFVARRIQNPTTRETHPVSPPPNSTTVGSGSCRHRAHV
jgi:hypothetical protein